MKWSPLDAGIDFIMKSLDPALILSCLLATLVAIYYFSESITKGRSSYDVGPKIIYDRSVAE